MKKIMIVEDSPRVRRALKALISQQTGANIIAEASNGREAIQKMEKKIPDIVLMDMRMPVMDGFDAMRIIKARWPRVKLVAMTMYPDCQAEAFSAGADTFIIKGCSTEELISKLLGGKPANPVSTLIYQGQI